jgi:hypothetical protein
MADARALNLRPASCGVFYWGKYTTASAFLFDTDFSSTLSSFR